MLYVFALNNNEDNGDKHSMIDITTFCYPPITNACTNIIEINSDSNALILWETAFWF